jgi:hypothetical protein
MAEMASDVKTYAAWLLSNNVGDARVFSPAHRWLILAFDKIR